MLIHETNKAAQEQALSLGFFALLCGWQWDNFATPREVSQPYLICVPFPVRAPAPDGEAATVGADADAERATNAQ